MKQASVDIERRPDSGERGTRERRRHDPVSAVDVVMREGDAVTARRVYQVKDAIDRLFKAGDITEAQMAAGRRFQRVFHTGRLDQLRAADLGRMPGGAGDGISGAAMDARNTVARVVVAMRGFGSPVCDVAWAVLGLDMALARFCEERSWGPGRPLNQHVAKGLLIGALTILEGFDFER